MNFHSPLFAMLATLISAGALAQGHAPLPPPTDTTPKLALGQMMKSGDRLVFSPCRDRSYATVSDISNDSRVSKALDKLGLSAGKKLYVELVGVLQNSVLHVSDINLAHTEGRCQLPGGKDELWRAAGNEPNWSLVAGESGAEVRLKQQGKPDVAVAYAPFRSEGGVTHFAANKDNQRLTLRFERQLCFDAMADAVFGWTATVDINGQQLKGCAWQR
jgi:putative lipoprotein